MRTRLAAFHTGGFLSFSRLAVVSVGVLCMQAAACWGGGKIYRVLFQDILGWEKKEVYAWSNLFGLCLSTFSVQTL
jgi:hypothetical protein